jgi:hypothetical protein
VHDLQVARMIGHIDAIIAIELQYEERPLMRGRLQQWHAEMIRQWGALHSPNQNAQAAAQRYFEQMQSIIMIPRRH